jgi:hypothetical protein
MSDMTQFTHKVAYSIDVLFHSQLYKKKEEDNIEFILNHVYPVYTKSNAAASTTTDWEMLPCSSYLCCEKPLLSSHL